MMQEINQENEKKLKNQRITENLEAKKQLSQEESQRSQQKVPNNDCNKEFSKKCDFIKMIISTISTINQTTTTRI